MFQRNQKISGVGFKEVWDRAMKILEFRDHSVAELVFKLDQRFEQHELIEQVIKECLKHKYLDDDRFAKHYVTWLKKKGKSIFAIKQELKKRGVNDRIISKHITGDSDTDIALFVAKKKDEEHCFVSRHGTEKETGDVFVQ